MTAPKPGDLFYMRDPDNGDVFTDRVWVIAEVEDLITRTGQRVGTTGLTYGGPVEKGRPLWSVQVQCDNRCSELGVGGCYWPEPHSWYLAADEFVLVSELPNFEVAR